MSIGSRILARWTVSGIGCGGTYGVTARFGDEPDLTVQAQSMFPQKAFIVDGKGNNHFESVTVRDDSEHRFACSLSKSD